MHKKLIGIDIGGTTTKIAFVSWDGQVISQWEIPTRIEQKGRYILSDIATSIEDKLAVLSLSIADFHGAGVGIPGPVQLAVGYLPVAVNLGGFGDINVNDVLSDLLGLPVLTDNDGNVAALGEMWRGCAEGATNIVFFTLGTGVGGGIIVDDHIVSGFSGSGGEVGHMPIIPATDELYFDCNCGAKGCVETVCSATGIVRVAKHYLPRYPQSVLQQELISVETIFAAAKKQDELALLVVDKLGYYLAKSFELLSVIVNPEMFVIGGGVSKAGAQLLPAITKHYGTNIFPTAIANVELRIATLENNAGVIGAARHARGIARYD